MRFNTPDNIVLDDGSFVHWKDNDAVPFFVLFNGKIIKCPKGLTHNDFIKYNFVDINEQRSFINSIMLQGRYWKKSNLFAFWNIDDDVENKIKYTVRQLSNSPYTSRIYYNHKIYELKADKQGYEWFKTIKSNKLDKNTVITDDKKKVIEHWFKGTSDFILRSYVMTEKLDNHLQTRKLNNFELLAATCYQIWADFFMNPKATFDKFTLDDLMLYIDLQFHGRISFKELFDYFHKYMRKKMISKNDEYDYLSVKMEPDNIFETLMAEFDFSDTEYSIINYEDSNEPYSCNVKTQDYDKLLNFINYLKKDNKFVVDRINSRKINDDINLYSLRVRKNPMIKESLGRIDFDQDKSINKKIKFLLNKHNLQPTFLDIDEYAQHYNIGISMDDCYIDEDFNESKNFKSLIHDLSKIKKVKEVSVREIGSDVEITLHFRDYNTKPINRNTAQTTISQDAYKSSENIKSRKESKFTGSTPSELLRYTKSLIPTLGRENANKIFWKIAKEHGWSAQYLDFYFKF